MVQFNYYMLVKLFEKLALDHPFVNNFYSNANKINSTGDLDYAAIVLIPPINGNVISMDDNSRYHTYTFQLIYADRMKTDRDDALVIQSTGIDVITEIINQLRDYKITIVSSTITNIFRDKFADLCAGTIANIQIRVPSYIGKCSWVEVEKCQCIKNEDN